MSDRCTGHCCRYFTVGSPEEFMEWARSTSARDEAAKLVDMLRYRGLMRNPLSGEPCRVDQKTPDHLWTCRHLVEHPDGTASCGNYENRPEMCRRYPNGRTCDFRDCTWDAWKHRPNSERLIPVDRLTSRTVRHLRAISQEEFDERFRKATWIGDEDVDTKESP